MNDDVTIVCFRVGTPGLLVVDGASKTTCEDCKKDVWIAPSSRKAREELPRVAGAKVHVFCQICAPKHAAGAQVVPMLKEQAQEIKDTLENQKRRN